MDAAYCVAVPVAVYLLVLTELHQRATDGFSMRARSLVKSVGILVVAAAAIWVSLPLTVLLMGLYFAASLVDAALAGDRAARLAAT